VSGHSAEITPTCCSSGGVGVKDYKTHTHDTHNRGNLTRPSSPSLNMRLNLCVTFSSEYMFDTCSEGENTLQCERRKKCERMWSEGFRWWDARSAYRSLSRHRLLSQAPQH
jgi:hypothetical protein